jgi:hypothetical protein
MTISETQLDTWAKPGPTSQFTATYDTLHAVLNDSSSPYYPKDFKIFLQGSYKNDTNVYGDSDVDIVIRLDEIFYTDLDQLPEPDKTIYNAQRTPGDYTLAEFKTQVIAWLTKKYGSDVKPASKAIYVKGNGSRRDADVLVCAKLRRYHKFRGPNDESHVDGICFFLPDGTRIENFPELHSDNCTTKHQETNTWFKPTVRTFKNLRNSMIAAKIIEDGLAPSYFIEGLMYNVPKAYFGGTKQANFIDVLTWVKNTDRSKFVSANEQFYLCGTSSVTWRADKCKQFLEVSMIYWDA